MGKERILEKAKKIRIPSFIHISEIIPGVVRDIERRIKEPHKNKKANFKSEAENETS